MRKWGLLEVANGRKERDERCSHPGGNRCRNHQGNLIKAKRGESKALRAHILASEEDHERKDHRNAKEDHAQRHKSLPMGLLCSLFFLLFAGDAQLSKGDGF